MLLKTFSVPLCPGKLWDCLYEESSVHRYVYKAVSFTFPNLTTGVSFLLIHTSILRLGSSMSPTLSIVSELIGNTFCLGFYPFTWRRSLHHPRASPHIPAFHLLSHSHLLHLCSLSQRLLTQTRLSNKKRKRIELTLSDWTEWLFRNVLVLLPWFCFLIFFIPFQFCRFGL